MKQCCVLCLPIFLGIYHRECKSNNHYLSIDSVVECTHLTKIATPEKFHVERCCMSKIQKGYFISIICSKNIFQEE